jgi:nicotinamide phosphoribosyltransferase
MRGMSGIQDATQCGGGHLLSFKGTDTITAIEYLEDYYLGLGGYLLKDEDSETLAKLDTLLANLYHAGVKTVVDNEPSSSRTSHFNIVQYENGDFGLEDAPNPNVFIGGSVPATEHAVSCMNGQSGELEFFDRLITEVYPSGIVSIVSDTWDFWKVVTEFTVELKDKIMARDGKVVIRPDSGDPVDIICGTAVPITKKMLEDQDWEYFDLTAALVYAEDNKFNIFSYKDKYYQYRAKGFGIPYVEVDPTPEMKGAVECLWDVFGGTETDKGFKTLDSHIGLIYGDSINLDRAQRILQRLADKGFSSANIVFGIGSFTYQFCTRDTFGEAVKATFGIVNGEPREIFKDPKTGDGGKKSAKGLIRVEKEGNDYVLYDQQTWEQESQGELKELFRDSQMVRLDSVFNIRDRLLNEPTL